MPETQRSMLKQQYGWLYRALVKLLADEDPMYLINAGAPADEYEHEAENILLHLPEATSPNELGQIIYEVFVKCFGTTFAPDNKPPSESTKRRFAAMGEKAWTLWVRWQAETQQD